MAHMVEGMFSVRETPWHKLGIILPDSPNIADAIIAAGLKWQVIVKPLYLQDGRQCVDAFCTVRESDSSILGVVGPQYTPLQNDEAFNFFQPFLDAKEASLETAGSLKEGKRVWVLAKVNKDPMVIVGNDVVDKYILLSNSHDGTRSVRVGFTPIRVVCNNTLSIAHHSAESKLIRIKHSSQVKQNLDNIREIMSLANADFEATAEQYRFLATKQINEADLKKYIRIVLKLAEPKMQKDELEKAKESKTLQQVVALFENGAGAQQVGVKGTWWAAYNGITEFLQHEKGKDDGHRLDSAWFGDGSLVNKRALTEAVELASAA